MTDNNPIAIRIPEELMNKIIQEARETERSRLAVIRLACRRYFEKGENKK